MGHVFKNKPRLFSIVLLSIFGVTAIASLVLGAKTLAEPAAFELTNAQIVDKSEDVTGDIVSYDNGDIKSNVALHNLNDKVTYRVSIKNTRDYDITITEIADNNDNTFLDYVYDPHAGFLIASGESFDLDIDVIYANVISNLNERSQDVSVKFTIKYDYEEEELGVPNTGAKPETDKKQGSFSLFLISMLGIIVCTFIIKNSNRKTARAEVEANTKTKVTTAKEAKSKVVKADNSKLFIVAGLLMVPLTIATLVQTATAITSSFEFTISTMFDIKDRIEITYEVNGEPKSEIIPYGGKVEDINQPQIPGYTFTGWTNDDGNPVDPEAPIYDDTHINPVFAVHYYSIHFNGNEATSGEMQDQQFVYDQAQTLTKNAFAKIGHNFSGWNYLDEDNNTVHYGDEANIENLTTVDNKLIEFVAEWTPITYHIKIDTDDDNTTDIDEELKYGECYTLPTNEAINIGYTANGWLINGVHYANVAEVCNLTTEDGGEVVVKPDYTVNHYTIHFDGNEATSGTMGDIAAEYDQEYVLPLNTFERTGFEYADWTLDGNIVGDGTTVKNLSAENGATVTLVARWSKDVYNINYYSLEGATVVGNPTRYDVEQEVILNAPTKTGYVFIGWTGSNGEIPMPGATIPRGSTGAKNFTAHWLPISYTVHFDGNNSDGGSMQDQEFFYDTAQTLNTNNFTRTGYIFDGWNTKADNSGDNYTNGQEVNNLTAENNATVTLFAQWTPIHYNVAFHKNSDSATGETATMTNIAYDDSVNLTANGFSYEHYKFMGWNTAEDGTGTPYEDGANIKNLTTTDGATIDLYAQWRERTAILGIGPNVNAVLRSFAEEPQSFSHFNGTPDFETIQNEQNIALATSNFPVYAWYDETDQAIYWWSEAERPQLNTASAKLFSGTHTENDASVNNSLQNLKSIDLTGLDASNALYMDSMFANTTSLESLNLDDFDSSSAVDMRSMFYGTNLASIDLSQIESQNVTDMRSMFGNSKFGSIDASKLNTQSVTNMFGMFRNAAATTIKFFDNDPTNSSFDTSKVTDMAQMFYGVHVEELDLRNFNTERVLSFNSMFLYADSIKKLDVTSFNTSNATNMGYMFDQLKNLEELDVTGFNTSKVTNMSNMFNSCAKLTELDVTNFDTSKVTIMDGMFAGLKNMEVLDLSSFDTGKVTTMYYYFVETNKLKTVYISDLWSTDALSSHGGTFFQSQSTITGGAGTRMAQNSTSDIYARIDDPDNNGKKGMFTYKNARYVRYHGNGSDDDSYEIMPSHYVSTATPYGQLHANAFTKEHYKFMGWSTNPNATTATYADEASLEGVAASKTPLELYAVWKESTTTFATFGNPSTLDVSKFAHYTAGTPSAETLASATNIATRDSNFPIYAWEDGEYYYWWSEAEFASLPSNSSRFFERNGKYVEITFDGIYTKNVTNAMAMLHNNSRLKKVDLSSFDDSSLTNISSMFEACYALETVILPEGFGSNATDSNRMFYDARKLKTINFEDFDSSNLKIANSMFYGTTALSLLTLPANFGKKIENASSMFNLSGLENINIADFTGDSLTNITSMFAGTKISSIDLSHWNIDNMTSLAGLFNGATNLSSVNLNGWDTSNIQNTNKMFRNTAISDYSFLESWNVANVESMSGMFEGTKDAQIDLSSWNVAKVKDMSNMFMSSSVTNLNISTWDTPALENIYQMFRYAPLSTLDISNLDTRNVTNMVWAFTQMSNIRTIYVGDNWSTANITGGNGASMFDSSSRIVGGAGTVFINEQQYTNQSRAKIDDPDNNNPGLLSKKNAQYIRYIANAPEGKTATGEMQSHYVSTVAEFDHLRTNAYEVEDYDFAGWALTPDGDVEYTDGALVDNINTSSKSPLGLYAQWRKNTAITTKRYRLMNADGSYPDEYIIESSEEMPMAIATSQTYSKSVEDYQTQSTDSYTTIGEDIVYSLDLPRNQYSLTIQINDEYLMFNDRDHYFDNSITFDDIYWGQTINLGNYVLITTMDYECLQYHDCKFKEWSQTTGTEGVFSDTSNINSTFTMGKEDAIIYGDGELDEKTYSLIYDANGGTGAPDTQVYPAPIAARYIYAVSFDISNQIPTRDGYGFWGWDDSATAENPVVDNSDKRVDGSGYGDGFYIKQPTTTLYAIWKPVSGNLQSWNGCADMSIGTPIYLLDTRDGQAYEVNKYKMNVDGTETACFTSNLNLGAWELAGDLTSENTNLVTPIAVDADNDGVSDWLDWDKTKESAYGRSSYDKPRFEFQDYFAEKPYNAYGDKYGATYNFAFATANTFNHENTWGEIEGDITADLCPSGWSMPTGGTGGEYAKLVTAYGGLAGEMNLETSPTSEEMALILQRDLDFPMAGVFSDGGARDPEEGYGIYWSKTNPMNWVNMTTLGMKFVHTTNVDEDIVSPDILFKRDYGASIRCIKR